MNQSSMSKECALPLDAEAPDSREAAPHRAARAAAIFDAHFGEVWRFLRRLGVPSGDVDDYAQEVMLIACRKLGVVQEGRERGFLLGIAYRIAADARRARARRRELEDETWLDRMDSGPDPETLTDYLRARAVLDEILDGMPLGFRAVFVLAEVEELSMAEIAHALQLPPGTVASRLRRSRDYFDGCVKRFQNRVAHAGGSR